MGVFLGGVRVGVRNLVGRRSRRVGMDPLPPAPTPPAPRTYRTSLRNGGDTLGRRGWTVERRIGLVSSGGREKGLESTDQSWRKLVRLGVETSFHHLLPLGLSTFF